MEKIRIVNLKCGGCAKSIKEALSKDEFSAVSVDEKTSQVSFLGNRAKAVQILENLGYPEAGSEKAKSLLKKAKSYVSCARGKMKK